MAALVKVVIHCTREPHWISLCNGLIPTLAQQQWGRLLHASLQRHNNGQFQLTKVCCDLIQSIRTIKQPNRTFHDTKIFRSSAQPSEEKVGTFTKIIEAMGFTGPLKYRKWKIRIAALRMYTCCVDKIDYEEFFNKLQIPDTFNSWFLIAQLHVWMCLVRIKQEGRAGKYMCYYIVYAMWEDAEQRGKVMGVNSLILKRSLRTLTEVFYASIFGYDECALYVTEEDPLLVFPTEVKMNKGILSDDHVLAAAIWRNLFETNCSDPRQLAIMVEYVRKQVQHLDAMSGEDLLLSGEVTWRPLMEPNPQSIVKPVPPVYNDEGL